MHDAIPKKPKWFGNEHEKHFSKWLCMIEFQKMVMHDRIPKNQNGLAMNMRSTSMIMHDAIPKIQNSLTMLMRGTFL